MARVQERVRADGGTSYRVMWVIGGGRQVHGAPKGAAGTLASETFTNRKLMLAFKAAVEAQDHRWPVGWVKGRGWVDPEHSSEPEAIPPTLNDVYEEWLQAERTKIVLNRKKPKSVGRDDSIYRRTIQPMFGDRPFASIQRAEIARWVAQMTETGLAAKTVRNRHATFHTIAAHGCLEMGLRADNPCTKTPLPRDEYDRQIMFFTHGEWALVRRCLRSDVHLLVDVALTTGMRWGEVSALRVGDLSWQTGDTEVLNIHIVRAWSERDRRYDTDPINTAEGETPRYKLGPTKSRKDRWVQVSGDLAEALWASLAGKRQDDYVFTTSRGNPWRYPDFHTDRWVPAITLAKQHGLDKHGTFHMLRHSFVVWLLADGESLHIISVRLGHAGIQITMDRYGGLLDLHDAGTAKRMARQLATAHGAILPFALRQDDIDARPVRPGRRGERRARRAG